MMDDFGLYPREEPFDPLGVMLFKALQVIAFLFFLALLMGAATFNLFYSFVAGLLMFGALYGFAAWATARDPDMLRILLSSSRARRRFDPAKHERQDVEVWP